METRRAGNVLLAVGGHPRSGTTLLARLLARHPEIAVTFEFKSLMRLDVPYFSYVRALRRHDLRKRPMIQSGSYSPVSGALSSYLFLWRYILQLRPYRSQPITAERVHQALSNIFPRARIVGDKFPHYIFKLEQLLQNPGLHCLIIYRDCRDVARSAVEMSRTNWRGRAFAANFDAVEKVADSWVRAIEMMERFADRIHTIQYEELICNPEAVLKALGNWLHVDPSGFPSRIIHDKSVGKHRAGLSVQEIEKILSIAGPTMQRLGYEIHD